MVDCALCGFRGEILFEDNSITAALPPRPSVPGHVIVFPKQHIQIIEQAPDDTIKAMFDAANKVSSAMFEGLKAQGTNLIVTNGLGAGQKVAHIAVDVIPRAKDDGLNFSWPSRKLNDEQMSIVESEIRQQMFSVPSNEPAKEAEPEPQEDKPERKRPDPFMRQLRRLP